MTVLLRRGHAVRFPLGAVTLFFLRPLQDGNKRLRPGRPRRGTPRGAADIVNCFPPRGERTRHSLNLAHASRAAAAVYGESWDWGEIAGVQLEGRVRVVSQEEGEEGWAVYVAKFPFVGQFKGEVVRPTFYRFEPRWARLIDNRLGFGHKEEI